MCLQTKPSIDDEEMFDTSNSYRSQYRFETTEDDLVNSYSNDITTNRNTFNGGAGGLYDNEYDPESMDTDLLRTEYSREQAEKV